jgi:integrase
LTEQLIKVETRSISRRARISAQEQDLSVDRLPWGPDGLKRLFLSGAFTRPRERHDDPLFWAPLIAVHQSTRAEEVLQLRVSDIVQEEGVWVMKLREGYVKSHKTPASNRTVPVHAFLLELGLFDLVAARRAADGPDAWLFGGIDLGHDGKFSSKFTKTFTRYRKNECIYDPSHDFHSLRKDFNSMLARQGVEWASRKRLMGHVINDLTEGTYDPCGEPMAVRREYINRIDLGLRVEWVDGCPVLRDADPRT